MTSVWLKRIFVRHLRFYSVMLGNHSYKQALAEEVEDSRTVHDVNRIELLIDVYFPPAREFYDTYLNERNKAENIRLAFCERWGSYTYKLVKAEEFADQYHKVHGTMQEAADALQNSIVSCIRRI